MHAFEESQCAARLQTGQFCTNQCAPNSMCCATHVGIEREFGGIFSFLRVGGRRRNETQAMWRSRNVDWYHQRERHRFSRASNYGYWFAARPCGIVLGLERMIHYERPRDLLQWLDTVIFPHPPLANARVAPSYVIYDRACRLIASFTTHLAHFASRWFLPSVIWLVDRFHFWGHSRSDAVCSTHCNPLNWRNKGLVEINYTRLVVNGGSVAMRGPLGQYFECWNEGNTVVHKAWVFRRPNGLGLWTEYVTTQCVNTEVCEQIFSKFGRYARMVRQMTCSFAEFFLLHMMLIHNKEVTAELSKRDKEPIPEIGPDTIVPSPLPSILPMARGVAVDD